MNLRSLLLLPLLAAASACTPGDEPISREDAARLVIDELLGDADQVVVLGLDHPLSAGDTIEAYRPAEMTGGETSLTATGDAWFFWIDDEPGARFDHPSRFVLVDRQTGEITSVDARWWPVLDGVGLWTDDDAYWSGDDWVHATIDATVMREAVLLDPAFPMLDCSTGGGHGVVINGWENGESGRKDFDNDGANMNDAFEGAGLDTTYFGPAGSENVDVTLDKRKLEEHLAEKATELGAGDTLVIYLGGHGWVSDMADWHFGETQIGPVWESELERWLAKFDPAVEIVLMIDGCHAGGMLDSLSCVADLVVTSTDEEKSAYGDLDFDSDTNPQDNGGEWTSSMLTCWNTIFEDPSTITGVGDRASAAGRGFFRQLVGECFEGAAEYDDVARRGLTVPKSQDGAPKTAGTAALPEPPVCEPTEPDDPTTPSDGTCEIDELAKIAMALGEILGSPSAGASACDAAVENPSGNEVLYSDGLKTGTAEGEVDLRFHGHLLDLELPEIEEKLPCEGGSIAPTLCPYETSSAEGPWVGVFAAFDGTIPLESSTGYYQYGVVFDADGDASNNYEAPASWPADFYDGTDRWFQVWGDPSYGFGLDVLDARGGSVLPVPSAARALVLDTGLLMLIPRSELGAAPHYRITAFRHEGDWGQSGPWSADLSTPVGQPLVPLQ